MDLMDRIDLVLWVGVATVSFCKSRVCLNLQNGGHRCTCGSGRKGRERDEWTGGGVAKRAIYFISRRLSRSSSLLSSNLKKSLVSCVTTMTTVNKTSCQYCYIDIDIDNHRSNLALVSTL